MNRWMGILAALLVASGCGELSDAPRAQAVEAARRGVAVAGTIQQALVWLGIVPKLTCGDPEPISAARALGDLQVALPCATVTREALAGAEDRIALDFPPDGCEVAHKLLHGAARFDLSGGDDRVDASLDLNGVSVDGHSVPVRLGYSSCGDQGTVSVDAQGQVARAPFAVSGKVTQREGGWFGSTDFLIQGGARVEAEQGPDALTFHDLQYEAGEAFPSGGGITVTLATGHSVDVSFEPSPGWLRPGEAILRIDGGDPVKIPVAN